ncbi:MAG: hypothetical protein MI921_10535 [Cytophagales bacterium]|nr:hypothetical protein [Cytophagales bacterium]
MMAFKQTENFKSRFEHIIIIIVALLNTTSFTPEAQNEDLRQYRNFFNNQIGAYQYWLKATSLNQALTVDSTRSGNLPDKLKIGKEMITLYLITPNVSSWRALKNEFKTKTENDIETALMEYFVYLMDLDNNQSSIVIRGKDTLIKLFYHDGKVQTQSTISKGEVEGSFSVKIDNSKFTGKESLKVRGTGAVVKSKIIKLLKEDLSKSDYRPAIDADKFEIKVRNTADDLIELKAINLTKRVIPGNLLGIGYYELLDYRIELIPDPERRERIDVRFKVRGKYGSGWFAPKNERYKPMAPRYQSYLNAYTSDLKDAILNMLQK